MSGVPSGLMNGFWRADGPPNQGQYPQTLYFAEAGPRREACIGTGAHTRDWTTPDVSALPNELICRWAIFIDTA